MIWFYSDLPDEDDDLALNSEGESLKSSTRNFPQRGPKSLDGADKDPKEMLNEDLEGLYAGFGEELTSPKVSLDAKQGEIRTIREFK